MAVKTGGDMGDSIKTDGDWYVDRCLRIWGVERVNWR